jgi:hypothetical protein
MFTQPFMLVSIVCYFLFYLLDFQFRYKRIHKQTPVLKKWVDKLTSEGVIKHEWYEVCIDKQN